MCVGLARESQGGHVGNWERMDTFQFSVTLHTPIAWHPKRLNIVHAVSDLCRIFTELKHGRLIANHVPDYTGRDHVALSKVWDVAPCAGPRLAY